MVWTLENSEDGRKGGWMDGRQRLSALEVLLVSNLGFPIARNRMLPFHRVYCLLPTVQVDLGIVGS